MTKRLIAIKNVEKLASRLQEYTTAVVEEKFSLDESSLAELNNLQQLAIY